MSCNCLQMQVAYSTKMFARKSLLLLSMQRMHLIWKKKKFNQSALKFINLNAKIPHYEPVASVLAEDRPKDFTRTNL